ncbi:unnamed protein product [Leptidea sinapis]|uniref:Seven-in-absentia protein TRAF-like domain-containing protein n=1 Tax=Leptidea sinapis TaxID=189913 RepID=A0A5E4PTC3_9NEOP|nr:unnamed protein product [Leptidea sinapis]
MDCSVESRLVDFDKFSPYVTVNILLIQIWSHCLFDLMVSVGTSDANAVVLNCHYQWTLTNNYRITYDKKMGAENSKPQSSAYLESEIVNELKLEIKSQRIMFEKKCEELLEQKRKDEKTTSTLSSDQNAMSSVHQQRLEMTNNPSTQATHTVYPHLPPQQYHSHMQQSTSMPISQNVQAAHMPPVYHGQYPSVLHQQNTQFQPPLVNTRPLYTPDNTTAHWMSQPTAPPMVLEGNSLPETRKPYGSDVSKRDVQINGKNCYNKNNRTARAFSKDRNKGELGLHRCPNQEEGCKLRFHNKNEGTVKTIVQHFDLVHPEYRKTGVNREETLHVGVNCMIMSLVVVGPFNFLLNIKIDIPKNKIDIVPQMIGTEVSASKWTYEVDIYDKEEPKRRYNFKGVCPSDKESFSKLCVENKTVSISLDYAKTFTTNDIINYKVSLYRAFNNKTFA